METTTPFDLNQAIQSWREHLGRSAAVQSENLDELESHLRDSIATLQRGGLSEAEAFQIATQRLGKEEFLSAEFGKVNVAAVWKSRAFWMFAGMLALVAGTEWPRILGRLAIYLGGFSVRNGLILGYMGIGAECVAVLFVGWLFHRVATGRIEFPESWLNRLRQNLRSVLVLSVLVVAGLKIIGAILEDALAERMAAQTLGQVFFVLQSAHLVWPFILLALLAGYGFRLLRECRNVSRTVALLVTAVVFQLGASNIVAGQMTNTPPAVVSKVSPATLEEAMKLWQSGKQSEAVEKFLTVDFSKTPLFPTGSVLNMTEEEFIALPTAVREKVSKPMFEDIQTIKLICAEVKQTGKTALGAQDQSKVDLCASQLKAAGEAFDRPHGLALLKLVGQSIKRMAAAPTK